MEEGGHFFVVVEMNVKYRSPARFDDLLRCERGSSASRRPNSSTNTACSATHALIAEARSILACVDRQGRVKRISDVIPVRMNWQSTHGFYWKGRP